MTSASRDLSSDDGKVRQFPLEIALAAVNALDYGALEYLIMEHLDRLDGIETSLELINNIPTLIRDATRALPLEQRLSPDHAYINKLNLLLRTLAVVRGIDHVLNFQFHKNNTPLAEIGRVKLKLQYQQLMLALMSEDHEHRCVLKKVQKEFNSQMIQLLHEMKLDTGIETRQEFKQLLGHYRNMASLIDPAKGMRTILQHRLGDMDITLTETALPITLKTREQKNQIDVMRKIIVRQPEIYNDFHSSKKIAFQQVNVAFCELLKLDDRRLPAQARLAIGPTIKNGYRVKNECVFKRGQTITSIHCDSLRCGTFAYVGDDDSKVKMHKYAKENLLQLQAAGGHKNIHMTMLLTDTTLNHQDIMVHTTRNAIESINVESMHSYLHQSAIGNASIHYSYIPVNFQGCTETAEIAAIIGELKLEMSADAKPADFMNRHTRLNYAAQVINLFCNVGNFINVTCCASGQDRTATAMEAAMQLWMLCQYRNQNLSITTSDIEKLRALGCHNAVLASLAAPGSPGMKTESRVRGYFSELTDRFFYRDVAQTNKLPPVDKVAVKALLESWKNSTNLSYDNAIYKIQNARSETDIKIGLIEWLEIAIPNCENKNFGDIALTFIFSASRAPAEKTRVALARILSDLKTGLASNEPQGPLLSTLSMTASMLNLNQGHPTLPENLSLQVTHLQQILKLAFMRATTLTDAQPAPDFVQIKRPTA